MLPPPAVLFQDDRLAIIDKPAGLPCHAGPRGGPSAEDWFAVLSRRRTGPWLAHRLDADTAGCLVVALKKQALIEVQAAFSAGLVCKTYWAVCEGASRHAGQRGTMRLPLLKRSDRSGWRMVGDPAGQPAVTDWRVLATGAGVEWLELTPRTGRTHQIRAHCAAFGHPVLGDPIYGRGGGALQLLARAIALPLAPAASATAPLPPHMHPVFARQDWSRLLSPEGTIL